ncbi:efflux RND transporter periplasmic adaptor subunit [Paenibacillus macerans]|uniref:efflux RND transporter periplasmic adaptor subunit n=1 Tax=Paenibacillus macerans TaxID=44252 RepID=UPI00203B079C|nr:efflux RND transporter periplasmic adaptor subunit [Paenibacillus macerans]MCM3701510.1 efflux RND transporter periplasmic adaptor subunit [Paenibacillus macerans]
METVTKKPLATGFLLAGTLQATEQTSISFEASGRILATEVEIGDVIQKGSILARMDTSEYQLQAERARVAVENAQAGIQQAEANLLSAQAGMENAQVQVNVARSKMQEVNNGAKEQEVSQARNAVSAATVSYSSSKSNVERMQQLLESGAVSRTEFENAQLSLSNAEKTLNDAKSQLSLLQEGATQEQRNQASGGVSQAEVGVKSAQAAVKQAQAGKAQAQASYKDAVTAYEQAKLSLNKTTLTSPVAGVVIEKNVSNGQLVSVSAGTDAPFMIGNIQQLKVLLPVPDEEVGTWDKQQKVEVSLHGEVRTGIVNQIYPAVNEGTGSINVEVLIPNTDGKWKPGQVISASKADTAKEAILIPVESVISTGSNPYVFLVSEGVAVQTQVEVGEIVNNQFHVISGLHEGEQIVTKGANGLFDGDKLEVPEEVTP